MREVHCARIVYLRNQHPVIELTFGISDQGSSTRSAGRNIARRFNAGIPLQLLPRRVATFEFNVVSGVATRRKYFSESLPALKKPG